MMRDHASNYVKTRTGVFGQFFLGGKSHGSVAFGNQSFSGGKSH